MHELLFGGYYAVNYNQGTGSANSMLCAMEGNGTGVGATAAAGVGCNNNWSMYFVGSRLQWDVTKSFYLGIEGIYDHMNSASVTDDGRHPGRFAAGFWWRDRSRVARQRVDGQRPYAQGLPALIV